MVARRIVDLDDRDDLSVGSNRCDPLFVVSEPFVLFVTESLTIVVAFTVDFKGESDHENLIACVLAAE